MREGDECLVIEDVVTSGGSVLETVRALREVGVAASRAVVLLNREQGGRENLEREGVVLFRSVYGKWKDFVVLFTVEFASVLICS